MKTPRVFILLLLVCVAFSCKEEDRLAIEKCKADHEEINCTLNLLTVYINLLDQDSIPVQLDQYIVTDGSGYYQKLNPVEVNRNEGLYPIIDDTEDQIIKVDGSPIKFSGFIKGKKVVEETYLIGFDCCHVYLMSDNRTTVISLN